MDVRSSKIVFYTSDYRREDVISRREIRISINCNIQNPLIDKIIIFWLGWDNWKNDPEYGYLYNPKVEIINYIKTQTYLDFHTHSLKYHSDNIIIVADIAIIFDSTINR